MTRIVRAAATGRRRAARRAAPRGVAFWPGALWWAFLGASLWAAPAWAEISLKLAIEPAAIEAGGQAVVQVTVEGSSRAQRPEVQRPPEVRLQGAGQSTSVSIINGRMTQSVVFSYVVSADRPGRYTIGPAELKDRDRLVRSGTALLTVVDAAASAPAPGAAPAPRGGRAPRELDAGAAGGDGEAIFLQAAVDRDRVYVGEQVTLRLRLYRRADLPVYGVEVSSLPSTEGFWREELPPERRSTTTIDGQPYEVSELVYALFPTQSGRLEIGVAEVQAVVADRRRSRSRDPFDMFGLFPTQRQIRLRSKALAVRAEPLPEPRPADFTGGVGSFRVRASMDRLEAGQNEPLQVEFTVEGSGNLATIAEPALPRLSGARAYPSGSEVRREPRGDLVAGSKVFRFMLVSENAGRRELPPIGLSFFDPTRGRYVPLQSEPLAFQVLPGAEGASPGGGDVARVGRDLRTIRPPSALRRVGSDAPWRGFRYWAFASGPLLLVAGALAWRRRADRRSADWGGHLSRGAPGRLRRDLELLARDAGGDPASGYDTLDAAIERYFTDRFHLPVRGLTREELEERLAAQGVRPDGIVRARELFDRCDFARFAPVTRSRAGLAELIELARTVLADLESGAMPPRGGRGRGGRPSGTLVIFLACAAWLPLLAGVFAHRSLAAGGESRGRLSSSDAAVAFARGNAAYEEGDYAAALLAYGSIFRGGLESADLCLNAGNAAFRQAELGWAVYFYERGLRLSPRDPDLRYNLDLARLEARDRSLPEPGGSRLLEGMVRLQAHTSAAGAAWGLLLAAWVFAGWLAVTIVAGGDPPGPTRSTRFGRRELLRWIGLASGAWLAFAAGSVLVKAGQSWTSPGAIVVATDLPVRSNPDAEATVEFTLHAGTAVRLGRAAGPFRELLFSDKLQGWAEAAGVAELGARTVPVPTTARP